MESARSWIDRGLCLLGAAAGAKILVAVLLLPYLASRGALVISHPGRGGDEMHCLAILGGLTLMLWVLYEHGVEVALSWRPLALWGVLFAPWSLRLYFRFLDTLHLRDDWALDGFARFLFALRPGHLAAWVIWVIVVQSLRRPLWWDHVATWTALLVGMASVFRATSGSWSATTALVALGCWRAEREDVWILRPLAAAYVLVAWDPLLIAPIEGTWLHRLSTAVLLSSLAVTTEREWRWASYLQHRPRAPARSSPSLP